MWTVLQDRILEVIDLGGPIVALLMIISVLALAVILYKFWQFAVAGVGRHRSIHRALKAIDAGQLEVAVEMLAKSRNRMAPLVDAALRGRTGRTRLEAEASATLERLSRGFRLLDSIAQTAPLLGLFGTVIGMIDAFRALQAAGSAVDPSTLAGGIWVALMTTAAGLAIAMPTGLVLTFLESRIERDRVLAEIALETVFEHKT